MKQNMEYVKPLKLDSSKQGIWFTSDTHFGHNNIIKFCKRPWKTTEEMDEALIERWNSVVKPDDIVFHLGDFAFATNSRWKEIIQRLNGHIYLIVGNHDEIRYPGHQVFELFEGVTTQLALKIDNRHVYLNHYPFLCYGGTYRNPEQAVIQLYGHIHSGPNCGGMDTDRLVNLFPYQYDVGVDNNNYTPVSWQQVQEIINKQVEYSIEAKNRVHTISDYTYKE